MIITITYDQRQRFQDENGPDFLCDIEWALSHRLRKYHHQNAKITGHRTKGKVILTVEGSDLDTVKPYMHAFLERMKKDGIRVLITYDDVH